MYAWREFTTAGGLLSYGTNFVELFRQTASYVDRIFCAAARLRSLRCRRRPGTKRSRNLKTAKALDLTVPASVLVAADEVIQ